MFVDRTPQIYAAGADALCAGSVSDAEKLTGGQWLGRILGIYKLKARQVPPAWAPALVCLCPHRCGPVEYS